MSKLWHEGVDSQLKMNRLFFFVNDMMMMTLMNVFVHGPWICIFVLFLLSR